MLTKVQYVEFLISTIAKYTDTHWAEHLDDVSHDTITDFLQSERLTARHLWELVAGLIKGSPDAFLIADDSVQDKRYSRFIELVRRQYSGAEHGLVRGIGVVNLVHGSGKPDEFYPIDNIGRSYVCEPLLLFVTRQCSPSIVHNKNSMGAKRSIVGTY